MKNKIIKLFGLTLLLVSAAGCGEKSGLDHDPEDSDIYDEEDDISESSDEEKELILSETDNNLLSVKFNGNRYNLDDSFSDIFMDAQEYGDYIGNARTSRFYNADGSESDTSIAELGKDIKEINQRAIPALVQMSEDGFCATSFYFEDFSNSSFVSADNISWDTSLDQIPDYYITLGDDPTPFEKSYVIMFKDSTQWDIQSFIDSLPESADSELVDEINDISTNFDLIKEFEPIIFSFPWKATVMEDYNNSKEYRNNFAVIKALEEGYKSVIDGKNDNMGAIYIHCKDGKINKFYYFIFMNMNDE